MNEDIMKDETWSPVYRKALPLLLDRLRDELDAGRVEAAWKDGAEREFPSDLAPLAESLGLYVLDLERALVVTCAELLGLDGVDLGLDPRDAARAEGRFAYLRVLADVFRSLQETLELTETESAERAGMSPERWSDHVQGEVPPEESLPRLARGFGVDVGELERRIVSACLKSVGLSSSVRLLKPGPSCVLGGVLLDDGRLLTIDVFERELWVYDVSGNGRKVHVAQEAMGGARRVDHSSSGALWISGKERFVELTPDLEPRRSYGVWGRRDDSGRLLENVHQWTFLDEMQVVAVSFGRDAGWVVRVPLTSGGAGRFEILESLGPLEGMERQFFLNGSSKLAVAGGQVYLLRVRTEHTEVRAVGGGGVVARYPGGTRTMEETRRIVGDAFAGVTALGLVSFGDELLIWRRQGPRYWLEDLAGRRWSRPRRSRAAKWVPVVGKRNLGVMEMAGEGLPGKHAAGLLWLDPDPPPSSRSHVRDRGANVAYLRCGPASLGLDDRSTPGC